MKKLMVIAAVLAMAGCSKNEGTVVGGAKSPVTIDPTITRATEVDFESGDAVGLTISNSEGTYADNAKLVYNGSVFTSEDGLLWYDDLGLESSLKAYYPYAETAPTTFDVQADQTGDGYAASDFMMAAKESVTPSVQAVGMTFKHKMTKIVIRVTNDYGMTVESITIGNSTGSATVDCDAQTVTAAEAGQTVAIKAHEVKADEEYAAILVPQTAALRVDVAANGEIHTQRLAEATLQSGGQYSMSITLLPTDIDVNLSGDIEDWDDKGSLDGSDEVQFEEHDDYFIYDGERYDIVSMKDGNKWMAENLRYVPAGMKPSEDLEDVTNGIWYPIEITSSSPITYAFNKDAAYIKTNGYFYNTETALGLKTGAMTVENCADFEGVQGICPKGWHIPTRAEIIALVGKTSVTGDTNTAAPYYDSSLGSGGGSIAKLNDDGFNAGAWGAISIANTTAAKGTAIGAIAAYESGQSMNTGYIIGSSLYNSGSNVKTDESGKLTNCQFMGIMPNRQQGTFNGAFNNYRNGASVRCVKDK